MLIVEKGEYNIDAALKDLREKTIRNLNEEQISRCDYIIDAEVKRYNSFVSHTDSWKSAFTVFKILKTPIGLRLISSLERALCSELPSQKTVETVENAWDSFSEQYKIDLDTRFGYMPDVMWSGSKYFAAVGWIIAGWLSPQEDICEQAAVISDAVKLYEECRKNPSSGMSGFHGFGFGSSYPLPFSVCGWATFDGIWGGVAFRINKDCFGGRDAVLYYMDDDFFGNLPDHKMEWLRKIRDGIERYSSGLTAIKICEKTELNDFSFRGHNYYPTRVTTIQFRLDSSKIKDTVEISTKPVPTSEIGEYIFVLPKAGEFYIELGEILDDERVPLRYDDFCMK